MEDNEQIRNLQETIVKLEEQAAEEREKTASELEKLKQAYDLQLLKEREAKEQNIKVLQTEYDGQVQENKNLEKRNATLQEIISDLKCIPDDDAPNNNSCNQFRDASPSREDIETKIKDLEKKNKRLEKKNKSHEDEIHELEQEILEKEKDIKKYRDMIGRPKPDEGDSEMNREVPKDLQPRGKRREENSSRGFRELEFKDKSLTKFRIDVLLNCSRNGLDISRYNIVAVINGADSTRTGSNSVYIYSEISKIDEKLCEWRYGVNCLTWNQQGTLLAVGGNYNNKYESIQIWDVPKRKVVLELKQEDDDVFQCLDWSKEGVITAITERDIYHWDVKALNSNSYTTSPQAPTDIIKNREDDMLATVQWSPCRSKFATLTQHGLMYVYNEKSEVINKHKVHSSDVGDLQWCPWNSEIIATSCGEGLIKIWRVGETIECIKSGKHKSSIKSIRWVPGKIGIASAHENKDIVLWTYPELKAVKTMPGHSEIPECLALNGDKSALVSMSKSDIIFWKPLSGIRFIKGSVSFSKKIEAED
mmetsp:Transcript_28942/g.53187  ORF Transcript_28942/g.53187 Transcript_28942/m.53187 type:complete len:534 (-) Transcript_28942:247-1848(-)|eukprot:CAMPEP_0175052010 /NCGR_PEP_ID=MMETSP0052_2-20121109/8124_1 /TAXON_ID=51329 ORGANISM="Polytomella parva, Strain SAG 63-3" /NCGR_SAMPLE_ID=MMETSP0052_2 /ASSEMBLY_ACC=CAM_ASM_000194 /LENGTH=533 /DNA_ID=CAMNT_0016316371 /DNA_START=228 /DNA_END=1829 /DNA_ORIENTATION=+